MRKVLVYNKLFHQIDKQDWPPKGNIFVCLDDQERLGGGTWNVAIMGDGTAEGDTEQLGIFWKKGLAVLFANTVAKIKKEMLLDMMED